MVIQLKKTLMILLLIVLVMFITLEQKTHFVKAAPTAPAYSTSYYMGTVDTTTHYELGYAIGRDHLNRSGTQNEVIILDYGGQNSAGTGATLRGRPDATYAEIRDAVIQVARGYWLGTGSDTASRLHIIVGTNTSAYQVNTSGGEAWAEMINDIGDNLGSYASQVYIAGGNDMEVDFATAASTKEWADGYDSVADYSYYNYGDAAGCTTSTTYDGETDLNCSGAKYTWKMSDIFYVSWKVPSSQVLPQIYNQSMSKQWKNLKKYGVVSESRRMYISGTLTQSGACESDPSDPTCTNTFSPSSAWTDLYDRLNADTDTSQSTLNYSTDIRWHE
jgi:hypothetical protein